MAPVPACARNGHSAGGPLFPATTTKQQAGSSSLRQRQSCRQAVQYCDNWIPQEELLFFETTKIRIGRVTVEANTAAGGPFFFEATKI